MKHTLSVSEARKNIFEISKKVQASSTHFLLTENGRPCMVILSADEYESLIETREALEDIPDLVQQYGEVTRDLKSGKYKKYTQYGGTAPTKKVSAVHKTKRAKRAK